MPQTYLGVLYNNYRRLKLPWRKRWLAGTDLQGNSYLFFRPTLSSSSPVRRVFQPNRALMIKYGGASGASYADVNKTIPVQWLQWLRYSRPDPPGLDELRDDVVRRERIEQLVQERKAAELGSTQSESKRKRIGGVDTKDGLPDWKRHAQQDRSNPGDAYQPNSWTPPSK